MLGKASRKVRPMDDRVERLINKAEDAADEGNLEQSETYRVLAGHVAYLARKEAKTLNRMFEQADADRR